MNGPKRRVNRDTTPLDTLLTNFCLVSPDAKSTELHCVRKGTGTISVLGFGTYILHIMVY